MKIREMMWKTVLSMFSLVVAVVLTTLLSNEKNRAVFDFIGLSIVYGFIGMAAIIPWTKAPQKNLKEVALAIPAVGVLFFVGAITAFVAIWARGLFR